MNSLIDARISARQPITVLPLKSPHLHFFRKIQVCEREEDLIFRCTGSMVFSRRHTFKKSSPK